jgi:hypothetical protein
MTAILVFVKENFKGLRRLSREVILNLMQWLIVGWADLQLRPFSHR